MIQNPGNCGKGFSVKHGVLEARGEIVLFTDADLSAPISEMPKLIEPIQEGECDVSFGSRALNRRLIGVHQSKVREFSGRIYNLFVQLVTGLPFKDTQCGFKAFRREAMIPVFRQQRITDFGFDPEMLYIAQKRGLRLKEVPCALEPCGRNFSTFYQGSVQDVSRAPDNPLERSDGQISLLMS